MEKVKAGLKKKEAEIESASARKMAVVKDGRRGQRRSRGQERKKQEGMNTNETWRNVSLPFENLF